MDIVESVINLIKTVTPRVYVTHAGENSGGVDERIVTYVDEYSYVAEQYNMLQANLGFLSPDHPIKTIVITSSHGLEGKSVTCCNLAVSLSRNKEKKTVLIDTDLRKPVIHSMFNMPRQPGFADVLSGKITVDGIALKPAAKDLYVIPAGSPIDNIGTIINQINIAPIIDKLKSRFDYIVFDTPPVHEFGDAGILGSLCDAVLLVVRAAVTQVYSIEETFHRLAEAHAKPRACILTGARNISARSYSYSKGRGGRGK